MLDKDTENTIVRIKFTVFLLTVVFGITMFFAGRASADEYKVADAIDVLCQWQDETIPFDRREKCMLYYTNCIIGKGGKWTDKQIFKCAKERKNVRTIVDVSSD